jgi:hypothetical protein
MAAGNGRLFLQMSCLTMTTTATSDDQHGSTWGKVEKLNIASVVVTTGTATTTPFDIYRRVFLKDDGTFPNNEQYQALYSTNRSLLVTGTKDEGAHRMTVDGQ